MTYRQKFAALYPHKNPATAHEGICPDNVFGWEVAGFTCPGQGVDCADCWDREIPGSRVPLMAAPKQPPGTCIAVKKALACCASNTPRQCKGCPYNTPDTTDYECGSMLMSDALAYIETLEQRLKEAN